MRKNRKNRSGTSGFPQASTQNLIVLLLVVLIIVNVYHLYLDHHAAVVQVSNPAEKSPAQDKTPSSPAKPPADSVKVSKGSLVPPALQKPAPVPFLTPDMPEPANVQIQVLNGCGIPGVAGKMRGVLRQRGFDVLSFGNAQRQDNTETVIIARSELPFAELAARRVAISLGLSADRISVQTDLGLGDIDVTLVIGSDYKNLKLASE